MRRFTESTVTAAGKLERIIIAVLWWIGMSIVAPCPPRFLTLGRIETPPASSRVG